LIVGVAHCYFFTGAVCLYGKKFCCMEKINIADEIKVFGIQVKTFPKGIDEAFDQLIKMLPGGFNRSFYGISFMDKNGAMIYIAAAIEMFEGEAEEYNCESYTIEKGIYLAEKITLWRTKTDCINKIFHQLMEESSADKTKPAIEWYRNEVEMFCMIKSVS
jgi:hypothetical protein